MISVFFSKGSRQSRFCRSCLGAFSLVEVVLALGVAVFGILAIVALLPVGIRSTSDSLEESQAINVLSEVIADRQATPFSAPSTLYNLPALTNTLVGPVSSFFGITDSDQLSTQLNEARYRVSYTITPPATGRLDSYQAYFKVSWPAASANPSGFVEGVANFPQP
jgi:type II secretory pathway pseudopilin PulG